MRWMIISVVTVLWAAHGWATVGTQALTAGHQLSVTVDLRHHTLTGSDRLTVDSRNAEEVKIRLSPRATIQRLRVNGQSQQVRFENGILAVRLNTAKSKEATTIELSYSAVFDDPVPLNPINTDNPGYGVTGSISEHGCFLLAGAGWYPQLLNAAETYELKIFAPEGWFAVTSGLPAGHGTAAGKSFSNWSVEDTLRGLALSVGPYKIRSLQRGDLKAVTYFLSDDPELARAYLEATLDYLERYARLFGPYPFEQFGVVENFFPTGYGFPGYTLLGGRVLRLPFIIGTSLGHEIAHCWWGNGVLVDYSQGNWSEGLTTYVADYLNKERRSPEAAHEYRRQMLRNYASLVRPGADFPLSRFSARKNPLTKAVGYDKATMVFHMLRGQIGESAFWDGLRDVYRQRLFQKASWNDLRTAFEERSGQSLSVFFRQWVFEKGAPRIRLTGVNSLHSPSSSRWEVTGSIRQEGEVFQFPLKLKMQASGESRSKTIQVSGRETAFHFSMDSAPQRLVLDPQTDLMRRLHPQEIPATVNSLKGAGKVTVLLAAEERRLAELSEILAVSLGLVVNRAISLEGMDTSELPDASLLIVGLPPTTGRLGELFSRITPEPGMLRLNGEIFDRPGDVFFGVFEHPDAPDRVVSVFWPLGDGGNAAAPKITHYGKYSYLVFRNGRNLAKGSWPIDNSPLEYRW